MQELNWNDLRFVLAVARGQTLAAAARSLGVNETTAGRRLAQAEARLGARLFERSQGVFQPTEAGGRVLAGAERVEREVQGLTAAVAGVDRQAAGLVRVTAVPLLVNRVLVPALGPLLAAHPGLRVELIAEPRDLSLTRREADVALRQARPRRELQALTRRVGRLDYAVYAPAAAEDPGALPWITYEDAMADLPQWRWIAAQADGAAPGALTVNDAEAILQAVRAGLGRSLLPVAVAAGDPLLRPLEPGETVLSRELWMLVHPELRTLTRIEVVMTWLSEVIARLRA